jgi:hypothetical protein
MARSQQPCLRTSLLLLLLLAFFSVCSVVSIPQNLSITRVTGDGSCVNTDDGPRNCSAPFRLTLHVVHLHLPSPTHSPQPLSLIIQSHVLHHNLSVDANITALTFLLDATKFGSGAFFPKSPMLPLDLYQYDGRGGLVQHSSFTGLHLVTQPLPSITAVSGCLSTDSRLFTANCSAEHDVLTLTGRGFSSISAYAVNAGLVIIPSWCASQAQNNVFLSSSSSQLPGWVADRSVSVDPTRIKADSITVVNDSILLIELEHSIGSQLPGWLYERDSAMLSLWLSWHGADVSDAVNFTLSALPAPVVSRWRVLEEGRWRPGPEQRAVQRVNVTTYPACFPGNSALELQGQWLHHLNVTVAGVECKHITGFYPESTPTLHLCHLPTLSPSAIMHDVLVQNEQGELLLTAIVGFSPTPTLSSISRCWDDGSKRHGWPLPEQVSRCSAGDVISIRGMGFLDNTTELLSINIQPIYSKEVTRPLLCLDAAVLSDELLSCVLPLLPHGKEAEYFMRDLYVSATWSNTFSSNHLVARLYDYPTAPRIFSVQGCGMTAELSSHISFTSPSFPSLRLALSGCQPGDVITIVGRNLNVSSGPLLKSLAHTTTGYTVWTCADTTLRSSSLVTCRLPNVTDSYHAPLKQYVPYNVSLTPMRDYDERSYATHVSSNYFSISFSPRSSHSHHQRNSFSVAECLLEVGGLLSLVLVVGYGVGKALYNAVCVGREWKGVGSIGWSRTAFAALPLSHTRAAVVGQRKDYR